MRIVVCIISLLVILSQATSAQKLNDTVADTVSNIPGIEIATSVDKAEIYVGDLITYTLSITYDTTIELVPPPLGANLGAFDVKDYQPDNITNLPDGRILNKTIFKLTTFTTGDYQIPQLPLVFTLSDGKRKLLLADVVPIRVLSMLTDTTDTLDIRPLKAQFEPERVIPVLYYYGGGFLLLILVVLLILWLRRKSKEITEVIDTREPWEKSFEKLALLKEKDLIAHESYKLYYFELTETFREYLGWIYKIDTLEMTTDEFMSAFKSVQLPSGLFEKLKPFFNHADLIKFARMTPDKDRPQEDFDFVYKTVDMIRVATIKKRELEQALQSSRKTTVEKQEVR